MTQVLYLHVQGYTRNSQLTEVRIIRSSNENGADQQNPPSLGKQLNIHRYYTQSAPDV